MASRRSIRLETSNAALSTDFGLEWATKLFGAEAMASLPTYKIGPKKGKPQGYVIWRKAAENGYCADVRAPLAAGQLVDAWIGRDSLTLYGAAMRGQWVGHVQNVSMVAHYLFAEGRARRAAEQAEHDAELAEMRAELAQLQAAKADADADAGR